MKRARASRGKPAAAWFAGQSFVGPRYAAERSDLARGHVDGCGCSICVAERARTVRP